MLLSRPNYIDYGKVLVIFCVLVGHVVYFCDIPYQGDSALWKVTHFVTLFHMPFFFFVSGMLFSYKETSFKAYVLKQLKTLFIPYVLYSVLIGFGYYGYRFLQGESYLNFVKLFLGIISGGDLRGKGTLFPVGPIWFVYALFFIKIIYAFMWDKLKGKLRTLLEIVLLLLALFVIILNKNVIPFRIDSVLVGLLFFEIGHKGKNYVRKLLESKYALQMCGLFLVILLLFEFYYVDDSIRQGLSINANFYGHYPILFVFSGIAGTLFLLLFVSRFSKKFLADFVLRLSNGMIVTLATHKIIFFAIAPFFVPESVLGMLLVSFVVLIITYVFIILLERSFPIFIGFRINRQKDI